MTAWSVVVMPAEAYAYNVLTCTNGEPTENTVLFYTETGGENSFCQYQGLDHIFSQVACTFTEILNEVLGRMYCGIQFVLKPIVAILLTLYIMVFGAQILLGTAQLTTKEMLTRMVKLSLVWTFVSESAIAISFIFAFFIDLANNGVWWAVSALGNQQIQMNPSAYGGLGDVMPVYAYIDEMIKLVVAGPLMAANSELIAFFCIMGYLMPPIFMIAVYWLITTFKILARSLISFLLSIAALAFLISLSPIFLSFMLFKATAQFFESWLKFMISYALQIAIVFTCVAMWAMAFTQFTGFFSELASVIFPSNKVWVWAAPVADPTQSLGICPYKVTTDANSRPHIKCVDPEFDPIQSTNPSGWAADKAKLIVLSQMAQKAEDPSVQQTALNQLVYFVFYYLISMIIVCYAFDALLKKAPQIAQQLAGPEYVPILGQGIGYMSYGQVGKGGVRQAFARGGGGSGNFFGGPPGQRSGNMVSEAVARIAQQSSQRLNPLRK